MEDLSIKYNEYKNRLNYLSNLYNICINNLVRYRKEYDKLLYSKPLVLSSKVVISEIVLLYSISLLESVPIFIGGSILSIPTLYKVYNSNIVDIDNGLNLYKRLISINNRILVNTNKSINEVSSNIRNIKLEIDKGKSRSL